MDPKSLRPFTQLSEFETVLARIILHKFLLHTSEEEIFHTNQYVFRRGKTTTAAIAHLLRRIKENNAKQWAAIFIDIV